MVPSLESLVRHRDEGGGHLEFPSAWNAILEAPESFGIGETSGDGYKTLSDEIEGCGAEIEARAEDLAKGEGELKEAEAAVAKRKKAVTGAEKEKADNTIHDGPWTVGVDIAAGTYRTTEAVGSTCYWGMYRSQTNGDDIIQNDIPGGGRPTVTLSKGLDFNTTRCGTWEKQ